VQGARAAAAVDRGRGGRGAAVRGCRAGRRRRGQVLLCLLVCSQRAQLLVGAPQHGVQLQRGGVVGDGGGVAVGQLVDAAQQVEAGAAVGHARRVVVGQQRRLRLRQLAQLHGAQGVEVARLLAAQALEQVVRTVRLVGAVVAAGQQEEVGLRQGARGPAQRGNQ
jgi:hypothetical protein